MSKVRNISGGPLDVPLLDRVVEDGETVEVPDYQPGHVAGNNPDDPGYDPDGPVYNPLPIIWPGNRWEPVTSQVAPEPRTTAATTAPQEGK